MKVAILLVIALAILVFHYWASRRLPRYWYVGGIIPLGWLVHPAGLARSFGDGILLGQGKLGGGLENHCFSHADFFLNVGGRPRSREEETCRDEGKRYGISVDGSSPPRAHIRMGLKV